MLVFKSTQKESSFAKSWWNSILKVKHSKINQIAGKQLLTVQRTVVPPSSASSSSSRAGVLDPEDKALNLSKMFVYQLTWCNISVT
jgi:hypothetical protein